MRLLSLQGEGFHPLTLVSPRKLPGASEPTGCLQRPIAKGKLPHSQKLENPHLPKI